MLLNRSTRVLRNLYDHACINIGQAVAVPLDRNTADSGDGATAILWKFRFRALGWQNKHRRFIRVAARIRAVKLDCAEIYVRMFSTSLNESVYPRPVLEQPLWRAARRRLYVGPSPFHEEA